MAQLVYNGEVILKKMKYIASVFGVMKGLMFSGKQQIKDGVCLALPFKKDSCAGVTNLFVFSHLNVVFVDSTFRVVDKTTLYPFKFHYRPAGLFRYIIESSESSLRKIKISDNVKIDISK